MGTSFLKNIRVIGLTWMWAGPWMGAILADMGAEVIKIETNQRLDHQRVAKLWQDPHPGTKPKTRHKPRVV